jgi:alpha-L-fucosidase
MAAGRIEAAAPLMGHRKAQTGCGANAATHDRRIQWWQEAKFGMFIHWGLYSLIGRHEWAMEMEGIPIPQYEQLAKHFNPRPNAARDGRNLRTAGQVHGDDHQTP